MITLQNVPYVAAMIAFKLQSATGDEHVKVNEQFTSWFNSYPDASLLREYVMENPNGNWKHIAQQMLSAHNMIFSDAASDAYTAYSKTVIDILNGK